MKYRIYRRLWLVLEALASWADRKRVTHHREPKFRGDDEYGV